MGNQNYQRVSRKQPCLICGKPDWCSRTVDASISFCARETAGADRLSRKERWGVFYHDRELLNQSRDLRRVPKNYLKKPDKEVPLAALEVRDFIYSALLRLSPASNYQILTVGAKGLRERGITDYASYGGLPCSASDRRDLAAQLRLLLVQNFPNFARGNTRGIAHVPGFWVDQNGDAHLWLNRDYRQPMLLIPYRSPSGKIQGCQIRFTGKLSPDKKRYLWLSLPKFNSAGSGTPIHFANWKAFAATHYDKPVLLTEGALKADVAARFLQEHFALAISGVGCAHELVVNIARGKTIYLAFDNDYHHNPAVVRQLARFIKARLDDNRANRSLAETKILTWTRAEKGIDDALAKNEQISELNILDWFAALDENCRAEVRKVWEEQT